MELKIFAGDANKELSEKIAKNMDYELSSIKLTRFSDGELFVQVLEDVRGRDVFVIQSTMPPTDNIIQLLLMIDAFKRASASRITAVIPYYGYSRQDKKDEPRVPITAKLMANLLVGAGIDRILTMDLHSPQIGGYFDIPVDHLFAAPVTVEHMKKTVRNLKELVIVSPDVGRVRVARAIAKRVEESVPIAIVDKRRPAPNQSEVLHIIGEVENKTAIIIDDIIDTGGTITGAANALMDRGAKKVYAYVTHPVLSGNAIQKIENSALSRLIVTDTIPLINKESEKIEVITISELLGEAILRIHENRSVSSLFI